MQLVVQSGSEPGRTYDITASQKIRMGRQSGNDVVVPDEQVSRRHAEIEERNGGLVVTDLGSSNGTFVNGTRITSAQTLQSGDTVQVGTTVLKVVGSPSSGGAGDYDQGATQVGGFTPSAQDYGYNSPAAPSAPANDYGQGAGGYGQSSPAYDQSGQGAGGYGGSPSYGGSPAGASYDQGQNAYGGSTPAGSSYGGSGSPSTPSSYDQGQNAYGSPAAGSSYGGSGSSYDQSGQGAGGYGQPASYGQGSQGAQSGQSPYGQSAGSYDPANPSAGAYGQQQGAAQPGAYDQNAYAQQPGGYNQGQPVYGGQQAYAQPGQQYAGQGQAAYVQPAPVVAKRGGLPLPLIIVGALLALLIIAALVYFLVLNKGGTTVGGDIPAPPNSTKLDVSAQDIAKLNPTANQQDISKISYGFYASNDSAANVLTFYQNEMKNRGWTQDTTQSDTSGGLYKKGDNSTGIGVIPIATQNDVTSFETAIPPLKGKLKPGQTLVIVASGPSSVFKTTPGA